MTNSYGRRFFPDFPPHKKGTGAPSANDNRAVIYAGANAAGSYTVYDNRPGQPPIIGFLTHYQAIQYIQKGNYYD